MAITKTGSNDVLSRLQRVDGALREVQNELHKAADQQFRQADKHTVNAGNALHSAGSSAKRAVVDLAAAGFDASSALGNAVAGIGSVEVGTAVGAAGLVARAGENIVKGARATLAAAYTAIANDPMLERLKDNQFTVQQVLDPAKGHELSRTLFEVSGESYLLARHSFQQVVSDVRDMITDGKASAEEIARAVEYTAVATVEILAATQHGGAGISLEAAEGAVAAARALVKVAEAAVAGTGAGLNAASRALIGDAYGEANAKLLAALPESRPDQRQSSIP